jgi:Na+-driven multidrug efflux pump
LLLGFVLEPGRCFNIVVGQSLRAVGDARFLMWVGIAVMWGIGVPLVYFLGVYLGYGLIGIWLAFITDEWVRGLILYFRWKSRAWEKKILVQPEKGEGMHV